MEIASVGAWTCDSGISHIPAESRSGWAYTLCRKWGPMQVHKQSEPPTPRICRECRRVLKTIKE